MPAGGARGGGAVDTTPIRIRTARSLFTSDGVRYSHDGSPPMASQQHVVSEFNSPDPNHTKRDARPTRTT